MKESQEIIEVLKLAIEYKTITISLLQRKLSIGFAKAGQIYDYLIEKGYAKKSETGRGAEVIITKQEFEQEYGKME